MVWRYGGIKGYQRRQPKPTICKTKLSHHTLSFEVETGSQHRRWNATHYAKRPLSSSLLLQHLDPLAHRRPAIMPMVPPTPLFTVSPRRPFLPLPLQPPHQFPQEPLIPAIRMSLNERVRLLPSPIISAYTINSRKGCRLTKQTNQPPAPSAHPCLPPLPTKISYRQASGRC